MNNSQFQFDSPNLTSLEFYINANFDSELFKDMPLLSSTEVKQAKNEPFAIVTLTITLGEQKSAYPFYLKISMAAKFSWEAELNEQLISQLLKANAPALLLSYIRPHIALITNSSKFAVYDLPFIDFSNNEVEIDADDEDSK